MRALVYAFCAILGATAGRQAMIVLVRGLRLAAVLVSGCGRLSFAPAPDAVPDVIDEPEPTGALMPAWARAFGSPMGDAAYGIVLDPAGNLTIAGYLDDAASLGGAVLTGQPFTVFAASYDPTGAHRWSRAFGGGVGRLGMESDASGLYLSGGHSGTIDFGGGPFTAVSEKPFIASLDHDGEHRWSRRASGAFIMTNALALAGGVVAITGEGDGTPWNFGGADLVAATNGSYDQFIAAYRSTDGAHLWSWRVSATNFYTSRGHDVALAPDGSGWYAGLSGGIVDFGAGLTAAPGGQDGMLVRFDAAGEPVVVKWLGGAAVDHVEAVALDGANGVVAAGMTGGTADLGGGTLNGQGFIAAFDGAGAHRWSRPLYGVFTRMILSRGPRFTYFGATFSGTIDIGNGMLTSVGADDFVLAAFDGDALVWAERFGGTGDDRLEAIALTADGHVHVTGSFAASFALGSTTLTSAGGDDILLASFAPVME